MKKARMPFQVLSMDGELLVEEERDLELRFKDKVWLRKQRIKANKRRCWEKNRDQYLATRKKKDSTIHGKYMSSKRKAEVAGHKWGFTEEEWQTLWIDAGFVIIPGTITPSNPQGERRTAFALRGPSKYANTYMARRDAGQPWNIDNCYIGFRGLPVKESQYYIKGL